MGSSQMNKLVWMLHLLVAATCFMHTCVEGEPQVPCFFIFGDSLSDSGNNNNLPTLAKFNYLPYGIDFPSGPTGRPTNGRHAPDFLSEFLGLPLIPPFANTIGSDILNGVNYASSSAGILVETGTRLGADISLGAQIQNHGVTVAAITSRLGSVEAAQSYLNKCLYYVNIGSNDYLNNYFLPAFYSSSQMYNLTQFADLLIGQYSQQLRALHEAGARKLALVGLGLLGSSSIFNEKQKVMVDQLNSEFSGGASFIMVNSTAIFSLNPEFQGFKVRDKSCCLTVLTTGLCLANSPPCENRKDYVFFDGFHPTEAVDAIFAMSAYNASNTAYAYPKNINTLLSSSP
ncbi:GDSL esterase/lipase At1g29670-like [Prosopis cineraria]|uniref:GDSL esterase/lipase At1g29670-like n=1 Tax=Prosopis cineraria TaxID=364024 RepID=UPI0024102A12|nr:GDSL esterase/lipase At1g29670-like [Prosopis cineraria]